MVPYLKETGSQIFHLAVFYKEINQQTGEKHERIKLRANQ